VKSKWLVLFLIWLMMVVAYFDRINISVAGPSIMAALHISKTQFGIVLAAFTFGYGFMQAPGGHFADRFGSRSLLIAAIIIWSVFTGFTGLAASLGLMIAIRVIFGFGEGLENGAQFKLIGEYFDPKERSFANSVFLSAMALGPAIGTPTSTMLIAKVGWRNMFFVFALVGLVVGAILFALLPRDRKSLSSVRVVAERKPAEPGGFREALRQPVCWLCAAGYVMFNMAFWGFLSWVPTYLNQERHIALKDLGLLGSLPYFSGFVGMLIIGRLGSTVFSRHKAWLLSFCYLTTALSLFFALRADNAGSCVIGLSVSGFFLYSIFGPFWAIAIDLAPPEARGVFTGSVNCCGQVGAFTSQLVIGWLADQMKSFEGAILFMMGALVVGGIVMIALQRQLSTGIRVSKI